MTKHSGKPRVRNRKERREWPFVVYLWAMGLGLAGYLIVGQSILANRPHPYHWGAGLLGVALGVGVGWLWYRRWATSFRGAAGRIPLRFHKVCD